MPNEAYWESLFDVPLILERLGIKSRSQNRPGKGEGVSPLFRRAEKGDRPRRIVPDGSGIGIQQFRDVAELGCGYGTFSIPVAKAISGTLYTYDVDPAMIARTNERSGGLRIVCHQRDVMEAGFGVRVDAVLLFNILHCEAPIRLLEHARQALRPDGQVLVIHWQCRDTPRGPSLDIRPRPEQIVAWAAKAGFEPFGGVIELPPWHYGLRLSPAARQLT
jgi:SAM-dependent methyltransferase